MTTAGLIIVGIARQNLRARGALSCHARSFGIGEASLPAGSRVQVVSTLKPTFDRTLASVLIPGLGDFAGLMIAAGHGKATR